MAEPNKTDEGAVWKKALMKLFKIFGSGLIAAIILVLLLHIFVDYPKFLSESPYYWFQDEVNHKLSETQATMLQSFHEKGLVTKQSDYVAAVTGYYSTIITLLLSIIALIVIVQFAFISEQVKKISRDEAFASSRKHFSDYKPIIKEHVESATFECFPTNTITILTSDLEELKDKLAVLTDEVKELTVDPQDLYEGSDDEDATDLINGSNGKNK